MLAVDVILAAPAWSAHPVDWPAAAHDWALAAVRATGETNLISAPQQAEIAVLLADDAELRRLNRQWRSIDKPTNVLSFAADDDEAPLDPGQPRLLGDIALAHETIAREAHAQNKQLCDHAAHMVIHGVLHLLGLDHQEEDEAEQMEALERMALQSLGIADPYAAGPIGHENG